MDHAFCKHPEGAQALLALKDDITDINLPGIYQYYLFFCKITSYMGFFVYFDLNRKLLPRRKKQQKNVK